MYKIYKIVNPNLNLQYIGISQTKYICRLLSKYKFDYKNNGKVNKTLKEMFDNDIENTRIYIIRETENVEDANEIFDNYVKLYADQDEIKFGNKKTSLENNAKTKEWKHKYYMDNREKKLAYQKEYFKKNFVRINGSKAQKINETRQEIPSSN